MTRVLVVDDQAVMRGGLVALLRQADGIEVVGEASDGAEAIERARALQPDVVLMDLRMPGTDGVTATAAITGDDGPRVLVLTTFADEALMYDALRAGASGYLLKASAPDDVIAAVRRIYEGDAWIDPTMAGSVIDALRGRVIDDGGDADAITGVLTPREQEVLRLVALGMSNGEITDHFVLSEATVKTHVARILMKTGSRDRAAAVALAWQTGFVRPGDSVSS